MFLLTYRKCATLSYEKVEEKNDNRAIKRIIGEKNVIRTEFPKRFFTNKSYTAIYFQTVSMYLMIL